MSKKSNGSILMIDDDASLLKTYQNVLRLEHYAVETLSNPRKTIDKLNIAHYDCVLLDITFPGFSINGVDVLQKIVAAFPELPVLMISEQNAIKTAVACIKLGAYDFIDKPIDPERLVIAVKNAVQNSTLKQEKDALVGELQKTFQMIGSSPQLRDIFDKIKDVAPTTANVLILGESGVGKELVARAIHLHSKRQGKPYVEVNCSAIQPGTLKSELFGHRKGAFTGAINDQKGKFQIADGGTLFLDEIGDMPMDVQKQVLRAIDNGQIETLGENVPRKVDVRFIAATNKNFEALIQTGKFREDLYYRLNVAKITIPPLRERIEDIPLLANYFLQKFTGEYNKQILSIHETAMSMLKNHSWPGNVRELRNVIAALVISTKQSEIGTTEIQKVLKSNSTARQTFPDVEPNEKILPLKSAVDNFEKNYILKALHHFHWKQGETARALSIDRTNLFKKMRKLGINK